MKNKLIVALIFALLLNMSVCGGALGYNSYYNNDELDWEMNSAGDLIISGSGEMTEAPWQDFAKRIKNVTISDGITSICIEAFCGCEALTEVTISDSVTHIDYRAFDGCLSLSSVRIGSGLETIGDFAFRDCSLAEITLPTKLRAMGDSVFIGCDALEKVYYRGSDEQWGQISFGISPFGYNEEDIAFYNIGSGNTDNLEWTVENGNLMVKGTGEIAAEPWIEYKDQIKMIAIEDGITAIGQGAFAGMGSLTSVLIDESVVIIESGAFKGCDSLNRIFYYGTIDQWKLVEKDDSELEGVNIIFSGNNCGLASAFGGGNPVILIVFALVIVGAIVTGAVVLFKRRRNSR